MCIAFTGKSPLADFTTSSIIWNYRQIERDMNSQLFAAVYPTYFSCRQMTHVETECTIRLCFTGLTNKPELGHASRIVVKIQQNGTFCQALPT